MDPFGMPPGQAPDPIIGARTLKVPGQPPYTVSWQVVNGKPGTLGVSVLQNGAEVPGGYTQVPPKRT
jgi:hypothetical protein